MQGKKDYYITENQRQEDLNKATAGNDILFPYICVLETKTKRYPKGDYCVRIVLETNCSS